MNRPNVIMIICDQMRGDAFGADGNPTIHTPNIDFLAHMGTRFSHGYSAVPSCLPARAILWTGMDQWHTGVLGMGKGQGHVPNDFPYTLPGMLSAAGYRTHLVGKGHFNPQRTSMGFQSTELDESGREESPGFQSDYRTWFYDRAPRGVTPDDHGIDWNAWQARPWHTEEYLHPSAWTMSRALNFLQHRDMAQPFFLNISFARPHSPYVPPQAYWDMYIHGQTPPPAIGDWADMHDCPGDAKDPNAWHGRMSPTAIHRARSGYYGEISFIDAQIGRLLNWFRREQPEAYRNTWFVCLADHGDMQGDHHLWRKTYAYEGSARIPLLIVPPHEQRETMRSEAGEVVELRDVMPSVLDMAGIEHPPTTIGRSLLPLTEAPADSWRDYILGEHCECYAPQQEMMYLTDGLEKYVYLPRIGREQLFDLQNDPRELHDCSGDDRAVERLNLWRGRLVEELRRRDCGWVHEDQLSPPPEPLVSPFKDIRWQGRS